MYSKDYRFGSSSSNSSSSGETEPLFPAPPQEEIKNVVIPRRRFTSLHFIILVAFLLGFHLRGRTCQRSVATLEEYASGRLYQSQFNTIKSLRSELAESVRLRAVDVAETHESLGQEISTLREALAEVSESRDHVQKRLESSQADLQRGSELDVLKAAKKLETGAGCKVYSHGCPFGFGYTSTTPLHPSVPIHSTKFPFNSHQPTTIDLDIRHTKSNSNPQIVGYKVQSTKGVGSEDWWQSVGLKEFGGKEVTFSAGGASSGYSSYEVEIFFISSSA